MSQRPFRFAAAFASFLAFLVVAAVPAPVPAQTASVPPGSTQMQMGNLTFSLGASIGQVGGTAYERVYAPEVRDFKVSELKWDIKDVAVGGVQASLGFGSRFSMNLGGWWALNEGDGEMVDRDWLLLYSNSDDQWTHESRHPDTDLDSGSILDLNLDFKAFSRGSFSLSGIVGYRKNEWEWSSRGGTGIYTTDFNGDGFIDMDTEFRKDPRVFEEGKLVIEYRQEYSMPYLGLGMEGGWGPIQLQGHLFYSPWVSAEDHDYHALRRPPINFDGDFSGGDWFGADFSAKWFFAPRWYATMSVEYQNFDEIRCDVVAYGQEGSGYYPDGGGMELETVMFLLGLGFRF